MNTLAIDHLSKELGEQLLKRNYRIATAESCTGGGLAEIITRVAGSSQWFECAYVTYSNQSKQTMLNVPPEIIDTFGAVSEETARAMAAGAIQNSQVDIAVAITGIAGPDGGSEEKPVGTVCFCWALNTHFKSATIKFNGDRSQVRDQSCQTALNGCIDLLDQYES